MNGLIPHIYQHSTRSFPNQPHGLFPPQIVYVDPTGLAAQYGVPNKATTMGGDNLCSWWITEINNRPLNLFFKENEVEYYCKPLLLGGLLFIYNAVYQVYCSVIC